MPVRPEDSQSKEDPPSVTDVTRAPALRHCGKGMLVLVLFVVQLLEGVVLTPWHST